MAKKLKVFRTPIGFHDAYVAAPELGPQAGPLGPIALAKDLLTA